MKFGYGYKGEGARAHGRDIYVSAKSAREVAHNLLGMKLAVALKYLDDVIAMKRPVKYTRYNEEVAHRSGIGPGRYPVNVAKAVKAVLQNAAANAKFKGLNDEQLVIKHISANRGAPKRPPNARAFSKGPSHRARRANVEIVLTELFAKKKADKAETKKEVKVETKVETKTEEKK